MGHAFAHVFAFVIYPVPISHLSILQSVFRHNEMSTFNQFSYILISTFHWNSTFFVEVGTLCPICIVDCSQPISGLWVVGFFFLEICIHDGLGF